MRLFRFLWKPSPHIIQEGKLIYSKMALSVLILQMAFRKTPQVKVILIQYVFFHSVILWWVIVLVYR